MQTPNLDIKMTIGNKSERNSMSTHRSDLSATALNPNSNQITPVAPEFPSASTDHTDILNAGGDDDNEDNLDRPIEGWPHLASLMAKTPDFAAFSRFRDLNIKSLLYYQAQLATFRKDIYRQEYIDLRGNDEDKAKFANRADFLMTAEGSTQCQLIKDMRIVLKEYNDALLQYSQISALPGPDTYNMKTLLKWLRHTKGGGLKIRGDGEEITWGNIYEDPDKNLPGIWKQFRKLLWTFVWPQPPPANDLDLVATRPQDNIDGFTRWVACYFIPFYETLHQRRKQRQEEERNRRTQSDTEKDAKSETEIIQDPTQWVPGVKKQQTIETWSEHGLLRFTSGVSTIVACLLPVIAIAVLSHVHGIRNLLLCIAGFAVIFAVGVIYLTNGTSSRIEIFTATAAFSAVLVVFISNSNTVPSGTGVSSSH